MGDKIRFIGPESHAGPVQQRLHFGLPHVGCAQLLALSEARHLHRQVGQ